MSGKKPSYCCFIQKQITNMQKTHLITSIVETEVTKTKAEKTELPRIKVSA